MIKSRYFPDAAKCLAEVPSSGDKIEIPADVYDSLAADERKDFFLRGAYPYEAVKIIAQSNLVKALEFDTASGEIKTAGTVGISAELEFAFAIWNFYDEESAIDRIIFSRLEASGNLPAVLSNGAGEVKLKDDTNARKDLAKAFAKKSTGQIVGKVRDSRIDINFPAPVSKVAHAVNAIKDSDIVSAFWGEIVFLGKNAKDIKDFFNGRISAGQLGKNLLLTKVGLIGFGAGYAFGGAFAAIAGAPAILAFGTAFAVGYGLKKMYRKTAKRYLDAVISDDSQDMIDIFGAELPKMLAGKFLTPYEMALLMEAIRDDITKERLKDMYTAGNNSARAEWARQYIGGRLNDIYRQRRSVRIITAQDWADGLRRVQEKISRGEDISAEMEAKRAEAVANMQAFLDSIKIKWYQLGDAVQAANAAQETQSRMEKTFSRIRDGNRHHAETRRRQKHTEAALDAELAKLSDWG